MDTTKAGIYNVYYTIKYIDEEIKTIQASKKIIIKHKTSVEDGATYNGNVEIDVEGAEIEINGSPYNYGNIYNIPGTSTMKMTGCNGYLKIIKFTINPSINGVEDGTTYYEPLTPDISGGDLLLDGQEYVSGTEISSKGNHTLEIKTENEYYNVINDSTFPFSYENGGGYKSTNNT